MTGRKRSVVSKDAIYGLAVGDALGVSFEFKLRGSFHAVGMTDGGMHQQPTGTWSDDTSMTVECGL
jgi:ADP-ribosylglycohydrolase